VHFSQHGPDAILRARHGPSMTDTQVRHILLAQIVMACIRCFANPSKDLQSLACSAVHSWVCRGDPHLNVLCCVLPAVNSTCATVHVAVGVCCSHTVGCSQAFPWAPASNCPRRLCFQQTASIPVLQSVISVSVGSVLEGGLIIIVMLHGAKSIMCMALFMPWTPRPNISLLGSLSPSQLATCCSVHGGISHPHAATTQQGMLAYL